MSGIYIPGIEMPDDCLHCPCSDLEYMDCNAIKDDKTGARYILQKIGEEQVEVNNG